MARATKERDGAHARIYGTWQKTRAWRTLSATALRLLCFMLAEYRPGTNGLRDFGAREAAAALDSSKTQVATALLELQAKGWIALVRMGDFDTKKRPSRYALATYPNDTDGTPATHAFLHWRPDP